MKSFCIAGPIKAELNYFIAKRLDWDQLNVLIRRNQYFVLHAPRQSGKTTAIEEYINFLHKQGEYSALYVNIEPAQAARDNIKEALIAILAAFRASLCNQLEGEVATISYLDDILEHPHLVTLNSLAEAIEFWSRVSDKPRVLFIDEIDSLVGDSLLSVLRQIRGGFNNRPKGFDWSSRCQRLQN